MRASLLEEILGSDDDEQEAPSDYVKGELANKWLIFMTVKLMKLSEFL